MPTNLKDLEDRLWDTADQLLANSHLKSSEYSIPVLGLIFLRFADVKFTHADEQLKVKFEKRRRSVTRDDYQELSVVYLPEKARWNHLRHLPEGADLGKALNEAMTDIEKENEDLRGKINAQLQAMLRVNKSRVDFAAKFEQLIADYNAGGKDIDTFFAEVISFARSLSEEEQRGISENLSEEEFAIFDLLIRPNIKLNKKEREQVKQVAKDCSTLSKLNTSSSTGANNKRPAPPSAWRFSTHWNNCQSRTPLNSTGRNAKWSISMSMRLIRGWECINNRIMQEKV